jgi:hypothetical protein
MPTGIGLTSRCAIGVESTWGTGVAVTELIPFSTEGINKTITQLESSYLDGYAGRRRIINSVVKVAGPLTVEAIWDEITTGIIGIERLIKGALGSAARDAGNALNKYYCDENLDESYTIAFNKQVSVWEVQGCKISKLTISGKAGEKVTLSVELMGRNLYRTGDAGIINASAAITGISPAVIPINIMFDDFVFRLADQANALATGDRYAIDSFELVLDNKPSEHTFSSPDATVTDGLYSHEFLRNDFRSVELSITLPRYTTDQVFTWLNNETALMADIKATSGSYQFNILLPNIKVKGDPAANIGGPNIITPKYNFACLRNGGTNTYLPFQDTTQIIDEIGIEAKSARTTVA